MKRIIIYRLEHPATKRGPYHHDYKNSLLNCMNIEHEDNQHPNPQTEELYWKKHYKCAFLTKRKLVQWFKGWLNDLFKLGFKLYQIKIDEYSIQQGDYQVIFDPQDIIEQSEISIRFKRMA